MIHEGSIVGEVRALLGLSDDAFWVAGDAVGQDSDVSTEYSRPTQGVVFVFQTLCCFCRGPTPIGEKLYRWSYDCVDITFDHSQGVMLLCNGGRTFRVSCCEDFAAIAFATQHLQKLAKASFAATKPSHGEEGATAAAAERSRIMFPDATERVRGLVQQLAGDEYVVLEIEGAIVTNLRIFFAASIVPLPEVKMMVIDGSRKVTAKVSPTLSLIFACSSYRQHVLLRLWLATLPVMLRTCEDKGTTSRSAKNALLRQQVLILERLHARFCAIDVSGDGLVVESELRAALGPVFSVGSFVSRFFHAMDIDGNGTISFSEFASGMFELLGEDLEGKLRFSFRMFDANGDGTIQEEELFLLLLSMVDTGDVKMSEDGLRIVCKDIFTAIDEDRSGQITYDEYVGAMKCNPHVHELLRDLGLTTSEGASSCSLVHDDRALWFGCSEWVLLSSILQSLKTAVNTVRSHLRRTGDMSAILETLKHETFAAEMETLLPSTVMMYGCDDPATEKQCAPAFEHPRADGEVNVVLVMHKPVFFSELQRHHGISLSDYSECLGIRNVVASVLLGSADAPRTAKWPYPSSKFTFESTDGELLIVGISTAEKDNILRMLDAYLQFCVANPSSLLPRLINLHSLVYKKAAIHFAVYLNPLRHNNNITVAANLHGVVGRQSDGTYCAEEDVKYPIALSRGWAPVFQQQVARDVAFLASQGISDYSLILGLEDASILTAPSVCQSSLFPKGYDPDADKPKPWSCCKSTEVIEYTNEPARDKAFAVPKVTRQKMVHRIAPHTCFHDYNGGVRLVGGLPVLFSLACRFAPQTKSRDCDKCKTRFLSYLKEWIVGEDDVEDLHRFASIPKSSQFKVSLDNSTTAFVGIDKAKKELVISNEKGQIVLSVSLINCAGLGLFRIGDLGRSSGTSLLIRGNLEIHKEKGALFGLERSIRFGSFLERERFLSDYARAIETASLLKEGTMMSNIKVYVATWNVGDAPPPSLKPLLHKAAVPFRCEIVCIASQECNYRTKSFNPLQTCENDWFRLVGASLPSYHTVCAVSLWSIRLIVLVHVSLLPRVTNIRYSTEATGIAGVMGNKGGVVAGLQVDETSIAFVASHLAAHIERVHERNSDFSEIVEGVSSAVGQGNVDVLGSYHHVFWAGDLNYRIDGEFHDVIAKCVSMDVVALHAQDQLLKEMSQGHVFQQFVESMPRFTPTYRFLRDTDPTKPRVYDEWKLRVPSWCDRILYKSLGHPIDCAKRIVYDAVHDIRTSDHSPVYSIFDVPIRQHYVFGYSNVTCTSLVVSSLHAENLVKSDRFGLSDPFVIFACPFFRNDTSLTQTQVISNTLSPQWPGEYEFELHQVEVTLFRTGYLHCILRDADNAGLSDPLGQCVLPLCELKHGNAADVTLPVMLHGIQHGTMSFHLEVKTSSP